MLGHCWTLSLDKPALKLLTVQKLRGRPSPIRGLVPSNSNSSKAALGGPGAAAFLVALVLPHSTQRRRAFVGDRGTRDRRSRRTATNATSTRKKVRISSDVPQGTDFYGVLGVARDATQEEIRMAYKQLIRQTHPDVNKAADAIDTFMQAQEAFRWLSDPQQREVYDGIGASFGHDAIYDYTDEPILGTLSEIQTIPRMLGAIALVNRCRKGITWKNAVKIDTNVKDMRARFRKYGAQRVLWVKDMLCAPLRRALLYPKLIRRLHPFERLSVEASLTRHMQTTGIAFGKVLGALKALKRRLTEDAAANASAAAHAERGRLATFIADTAIEEMWELVTNHEPVFQQLLDCQNAIFRAPCIDLDKPTVVFVGAPNVGKSSLVRSMSTGRPEVNDYCFTTKELTIGHMWHFIAGTPLLIHGQIVDSPGIRSAPGSSLNLLEELTLGALEHLPTAVVFVFDPDPTTHGLVSVDQQVELRESLRKKFPRRPWLDLISKADVILDEALDARVELSKRYPDALHVSALDGTGLGELNTEVRRLLEEMTRVVRQLQRTKIRQIRAGVTDAPYVGKEALTLR